MEETPMLFPIAPSEFWKQIRATLEEVVTEKLSPHHPANSHLPQKALLKATDCLRDLPGLQAYTL